MKKILLGVGLLTAGTLSAYMWMSSSPPEPLRFPASVPEKYESLSACEKQDVLWERVEGSVHKQLPEYQKLGLMQVMAMAHQELSLKGSMFSDFAPDGWKKYLHRRGAVAKVKIVPVKERFGGIFEGADCAILRLSLTYTPGGSKPVAPGLALKVLRDNMYSANISALVSLDGQGDDYDFFRHPMSNIVPTGEEMGQKLVHAIFKKVSPYPEELSVQDMATMDSAGKKSPQSFFPRQLFFVPSDSVKSSSKKHDVREDFVAIQEGTVVYHIYALSDKHANFKYSNYTPDMAKKFLKDSEHVADVVTTSSFVASAFGDDGMFFRHQFRY